MRKGIISCLLFISFWLAGCQQRKEVEVQIIPQPQSSELSSGTYGLPRQAVFSTNLPEEDKKEFTEYLQASPFALQPEAEGTQKSVVSFTIIAPVSDQESMESYQLSITGKGISVVAPSAAGLFYGFQSLLHRDKRFPSFFIQRFTSGCFASFPYQRISQETTRCHGTL